MKSRRNFQAASFPRISLWGVEDVAEFEVQAGWRFRNARFLENAVAKKTSKTAI